MSSCPLLAQFISLVEVLSLVLGSHSSSLEEVQFISLVEVLSLVLGSHSSSLEEVQFISLVEVLSLVLVLAEHYIKAKEIHFHNVPHQL